MHKEACNKADQTLSQTRPCQTANDSCKTLESSQSQGRTKLQSPSCCQFCSILMQCQCSVSSLHTRVHALSQPVQSSHSLNHSLNCNVVNAGATQGPAGSVVPEAPSASEAETGQSEDQPSEFEPGIVAIEGAQMACDRCFFHCQTASQTASQQTVLDAMQAEGTTDDRILQQALSQHLT